MSMDLHRINLVSIEMKSRYISNSIVENSHWKFINMIQRIVGVFFFCLFWYEHSSIINLIKYQCKLIDWRKCAHLRWIEYTCMTLLICEFLRQLSRQFDRKCKIFLHYIIFWIFSRAWNTDNHFTHSLSLIIKNRSFQWSNQFKIFSNSIELLNLITTNKIKNKRNWISTEIFFEILLAIIIFNVFSM